MYEFTCQLAALEPFPSEMQRLFRVLRDNQTEADRFPGTIAGTVSIREFVTQENQERLVSS